MTLSAAYTVAPGKIPELFQKLKDAQAPDQLSNSLLKDWGFTSSNDRALIPILKALGFLSPDGKPTARYHEYRDHSRSMRVVGDGLKEAYRDIFLIKEKPTDADRPAISGKFKSFHNVSDNVARVMTSNFFQLLALADLGGAADPATKVSEANKIEPTLEVKNGFIPEKKIIAAGLHYNIQIHLPATKDIEVYNAIFKALRDHLIHE